MCRDETSSEPPPPRLLAILLDGGHDGGGNPCRCYVVLTESGAVYDVLDQKYAGRRPLDEKYPGTPIGVTIKVPKGEYNDFMKLAKR